VFLFSKGMSIINYDYVTLQCMVEMCFCLMLIWLKNVVRCLDRRHNNQLLKDVAKYFFFCHLGL